MWPARLDAAHSAITVFFPVRSCCLNPIFKMEGYLSRADLSTGESGIYHSSVHGEQVTPYTVNKAFIQNN